LDSNKAVAGGHDLEGAFNQNFDFDNFYYYVRVDINRSNANSTAIFYGVRVLSLQFLPVAIGARRRDDEIARARPCPLWVKSGHRIRSAPCLLYPRKRTLDNVIGMSALCHKRTSRHAQACVVRGINTASMIATRMSAGASPTR
jgi:hypothetical protein